MCHQDRRYHSLVRPQRLNQVGLLHQRVVMICRLVGCTESEEVGEQQGVLCSELWRSPRPVMRGAREAMEHGHRRPRAEASHEAPSFYTTDPERHALAGTPPLSWADHRPPPILPRRVAARSAETSRPPVLMGDVERVAAGRTRGRHADPRRLLQRQQRCPVCTQHGGSLGVDAPERAVFNEAPGRSVSPRPSRDHGGPGVLSR